MIRRLLVLCAAVAFTACAPDVRSAVDGMGDAGPGDIDAATAPPDSSFIDAANLLDGGLEKDTVYVHSKDTLYAMDPTSFALTMVGLFNAPSADQMTDL